MLKITITGFNGSDLILMENNHTNNGRSSAYATEQVKWEVQGDSGVREIVEIRMKGMIGNDDIFSKNPPKDETGSQKKIWKAKVNRNALVGDVYIYYIKWIKASDGLTYTFDPIISIKPRVAISMAAVAVTTFVVVSAFSYMLYKIYMLQRGLH